jgi:hypothetical protein
MADFPETAKFLTEPERAAVRRRLVEDVGGSAYEVKYSWSSVGSVFRDCERSVWQACEVRLTGRNADKIFLGALMYLGCIVPAYSYAYFAPSIIKGLGYSAVSAQLHSVPPWVASFGLAMALAALSDRVRHRCVFGLAAAALGLAGFAVLLAHPPVHVQYAALFLAAAGVYAAMPIFIGWFATNLSGHLRRGVGAAFQIGFGNIGGIVASYLFPAHDAPRYTTGYAVSAAALVVAMGAAVAYYAVCRAQNAAREARVAAGERDDDLTPKERELQGDLSLHYRYLL